MQRLIKSALLRNAPRVHPKSADPEVIERLRLAGAERSKRALIWRNWIAKKKEESNDKR